MPGPGTWHFPAAAKKSSGREFARHRDPRDLRGGRAQNRADGSAARTARAAACSGARPSGGTDDRPIHFRARGGRGTADKRRGRRGRLGAARSVDPGATAKRRLRSIATAANEWSSPLTTWVDGSSGDSPTACWTACSSCCANRHFKGVDHECHAWRREMALSWPSWRVGYKHNDRAHFDDERCQLGPIGQSLRGRKSVTYVSGGMICHPLLSKGTRDFCSNRPARVPSPRRSQVLGAAVSVIVTRPYGSLETIGRVTCGT